MILNPRALTKYIYHFGWLLLLMMFLYVVVKPLFQDASRIDGEVMYAAGRVLAHGMSPYSAVNISNEWFAATGKTYWNPSQVFAYPPTSLPLFWLFGQVPPAVSLRILDLLNIGAELSLLYFLASFLRSLRPTLDSNRLVISLLLALLPSFHSINMFYGQTAVLAVAGLMGGVYCLREGRSYWASILIAVFALLKPQLTLVPVLSAMFLFGNRRDWLILTAVGSAWLLAAVLMFGTTEIFAFGAAIKQYSIVPENNIGNMTGLARIASKFGVDIQNITSLVISCIVALLFGYLCIRKIENTERNNFFLSSKAELFFGVLVLNEFLVSLHECDHSILALPLSMLVLMNIGSQLLALPLLVLVARPALAQVLFSPNLDRFDVISFCLGLASVVLIGHLFGRYYLRWPLRKLWKSSQ